MKEIRLTKGQVALVDDDDYDELNRLKWYAKWDKDTQSYYAERDDSSPLHRKTIHMHREIMNTPKGLDCDHRNHNTLDNRKENLRNVTHSQNQMNRRGANSNNSLGERGISRNGDGFQVRVKVDGKRVYDKTFRTIEAAVAARDAALKEHHGEFSS